MADPLAVVNLDADLHTYQNDIETTNFRYLMLPGYALHGVHLHIAPRLRLFLILKNGAKKIENLPQAAAVCDPYSPCVYRFRTLQVYGEGWPFQPRM